MIYNLQIAENIEDAGKKVYEILEKILVRVKIKKELIML